MNRIRLAVALALGWAASASADDWGEVAQISTTLGVQANRLCLGEGSRGDIGCPSYSPHVDPATGNVGIGTTASTSALTVYGNMRFTPSSSYIQFATSTIYNYNNTLMFTVGGPSNAVPLRINNTNGNVDLVTSGGGSVGVRTATPSTSLHVSGTILISNDGTACDANRAGAMRWHAGAGQFQVCYGSGGWALLSSAAVSGTLGTTPDRIVSGTTSVIASQDRSVTISTAGSSRVTIGENGYVGIGTTQPSYALDVVGTIRSTGAGFFSDRIYSGSAGSAGSVYLLYGSLGSTSYFSMVSGEGGVNNFRIKDVKNSNQTRLMINNAGYVGISTTNPSKTLTVNGDAAVSGTVQVAGTGAESCTASTLGQIRLNPTSGKFEVCRH